MVKSIIIKKNGGPEVLEVVDVKVGKPGPEEIKIKNIAIGLNYIDTYHRSGLYPFKIAVWHWIRSSWDCSRNWF